MKEERRPTRRRFGRMVSLALAGSAVPALAQDHWDICVYGGTSAGAIAAIQAARMGKSVVLVEAGDHIGGMSAEGLGATDIDNHKPFQNSPGVGGLALEFYRRLAAHYGYREKFDEMIAERRKDRTLWKFEPHLAERVFDEWLADEAATVLTRHRLAENGVRKQGTTIQSIRCENGADIHAHVFLDATYEGDLLACAGVPFHVGREGQAKYGESKNGIRVDTSHQQLDRAIDPYQRPGVKTSGTIFGVSGEPLGEEGAASDAIQSFSFRLCLTKNPANRMPIEKPVDYDRRHYTLLQRYFDAGGRPRPSGFVLPNGKTEPGSWHRLVGFLTGWNHDWNTASYARRERMLSDSLRFVQGTYWFLANDASVPAEQREIWSDVGLCRDEFTDNGGWPRIFYVRNGRRMVSDFVMTQAHGSLRDPEPVADPVCLAWWPHDLHSARQLVKGGQVWMEGAVFNEEQDWRPFGVAYRSLAPPAGTCDNLLTPTCPSMSYVAYGAFRVEWTFMAAAQGAATAAALALEEGVGVRDVDYAALRARLKRDGQVLEVPEAR